MNEIMNFDNNQKLYKSNSCENKTKGKGVCPCQCECVNEKISICDISCINECCVCYKGVEQFTVCGMTFIKAGYEICIKYIDCNGNKKSVRKIGNVLFFACPQMFSPNLSVHISNPPSIKVCENYITAQFSVALCW